MKWDRRKITGLAMVTAISYVVMLAGLHFMSAAPYLKYEAKDVVLTVGGFIYGPIGAVAAAFVVAFMEMVTISNTAFIGLVMNFFAAASYAGVASLVYRKYRSTAGAAAGLALGSASLCCVMLLWNYIFTPIYTGMPRATVAGMLLPIFLPFNLIKAGLNSAIILVVYKPLTTALRAARLLPAREAVSDASGINITAAASDASSASQLSYTPASGVTDAAPAPVGGTGGKFKVNIIMLACAGLLFVACAIAIYFVSK